MLCWNDASFLNFIGTSKREEDEPLKSKFEKIGSVSVTRCSLKQTVFNLKQQSNVVCAIQLCLQVDPDVAMITDDLPLEGYLVYMVDLSWYKDTHMHTHAHTHKHKHITLSHLYMYTHKINDGMNHAPLHTTSSFY